MCLAPSVLLIFSALLQAYSCSVIFSKMVSFIYVQCLLSCKKMVSHTSVHISNIMFLPHTTNYSCTLWQRHQQPCPAGVCVATTPPLLQLLMATCGRTPLGTLRRCCHHEARHVEGTALHTLHPLTSGPPQPGLPHPTPVLPHGSMMWRATQPAPSSHRKSDEAFTATTTR